MFAFRCKTCGHFESAGQAGECLVPHACSVCSNGVIFTPQGIKIHKADNWEILADATPERLKELGLEEVERHKPFAKGEIRAPRLINIITEDNLKTKDNL